MVVLPSFYVHITEYTQSGPSAFPCNLFDSPPPPVPPPTPPRRKSFEIDVRLSRINVYFFSMNKSLEHSTCSSEQTKSTSQVAYAIFDKVDSFEVEPTDDAVAGMQVRVAFGVVHLFRSLKEAEAHKPTPGLKPAAEDEAVGTVLGMISVPASLNASKLLAFLAPAREAIQHMRVIRCVF